MLQQMATHGLPCRVGLIMQSHSLHYVSHVVCMQAVCQSLVETDTLYSQWDAEGEGSRQMMNDDDDDDGKRTACFLLCSRTAPLMLCLPVSLLSVQCLCLSLSSWLCLYSSPISS
jgi:hypothetical protein